MTFTQLGDIFAKGPVSPDLESRRSTTPRRTGQPVRKHSRPKGQAEGLFWRKTNRAEVSQIMLAARRYELATRQPGARNGALGFVAIELLELFTNLVSFKTGQLDPAIETLMRMLRRSRDAIVRALKALRTHGFLDWLRRFVPTGNEGRGPQVRQTSNAYRLFLPARALRLVDRWIGATPIPDDFSHAQEANAAILEEHRAALPVDERLIFDDHPFAEGLGRLYKMMMKERESAKQTESRSKFLS